MIKLVNVITLMTLVLTTLSIPEMGFITTTDGVSPPKRKTASRRRSLIPEPAPTLTKCIWKQFPLPKLPQVYQVAYCQDPPRKKHRHRVVRAQFTHTSILTAIRNCVFNLQGPRTSRPRRRRREQTESVQDLICSLKCDIKKLSKYEEEIANNPEKVQNSDPFFILPAMMCKLNKLEDCILKSIEYDKTHNKKKEILTTAKIIRKSLADQLRCDEKMAQEKRRKLCCFIKSLQIFERQIKCSNKGAICMTGGPKKCSSKADFCTCADKTECCEKCKKPDDACNSPGNHDITGLNLVYTKGNIEKDCQGRERFSVQNRVCCGRGEGNDCQVTVMKDGNFCDVCNDPEMKARINQVTRLWLESARELVETIDCPPC